MSSLFSKNATFIELFEKGAYKGLLYGLEIVFILSITSIIIGILIGTIVASVNVAPKYKKTVKIWDKINQLYVYLFRGTPFVVQLLIIYFVLRPLLHLRIGEISTAILVMGLNSGAYVSEIVRGGINSVDPGQLEAGRVVGMSYMTSMRKIVIPQAVKNIVPTMGNEFITLLKDTSVVSFIGIVDMTKFFQNIANTTGSITPYLLLGLIYLILVLVATVTIKAIEKKLRKNEKKR